MPDYPFVIMIALLISGWAFTLVTWRRANADLVKSCEQELAALERDTSRVPKHVKDELILLRNKLRIRLLEQEFLLNELEDWLSPSVQQDLYFDERKEGITAQLKWLNGGASDIAYTHTLLNYSQQDVAQRVTS